MAEYIDRNGLIEALNKFAPEHYSALINQLITKYPAADVVEVKHGEWIMIPVNGVAEYRCGNIDCCRIIPFGQSPYKMLYCPYCGAKMDGGAE